MSNGIGNLMADTAVGIFSGERRGENFQRRKNPQNELELLESKDILKISSSSLPKT